MAQEKNKKLVIRTETLRELSTSDLTKVVGGAGTQRSLLGSCAV